MIIMSQKLLLISGLLRQMKGNFLSHRAQKFVTENNVSNIVHCIDDILLTAETIKSIVT